MERGEKIKDVLERAEDLKDHTNKAKWNARKHHGKSFVKKYLMYILGGIMLTMCILFIYFFIN